MALLINMLGALANKLGRINEVTINPLLSSLVTMCATKIEKTTKGSDVCSW